MHERGQRERGAAGVVISFALSSSPSPLLLLCSDTWYAGRLQNKPLPNPRGWKVALA